VARGEDREVNALAAAGRAGRRCVAAIALAAVPALSPAAEQHAQADVPYVPTPANVVDAMLKLAGIGPRDFVVDLGSGDGRIVIAAAKQLGARGLGVEIDGALVSRARSEAQRQGVADRVQFREENLFITDFGHATAMTLYLYPRVLMQLRPRLLGELKPGTRIVSHDFDMEDWQPDARVTVPVPGKPYGPPSSEIYLWVVPANAAGTWRWRSAIGGTPAEAELALTQSFQVLEGRPLLGGRPARFEAGRVRGDEIRFMLTTLEDGRALRQAFSGRLDGDTISGKVQVGGNEHAWQATRVRRGSIDVGGR
jgi:hypothetical protein